MPKGNIPSECPRCDALQNFEPKKRMIKNKGHVIEVFIHCSVCRYDRVLRTSTLEIENLRRLKMFKLNTINLFQKAGIEAFVSKSQLATIQQALTNKESELRERLSNDSE